MKQSKSCTSQLSKSEKRRQRYLANKEKENAGNTARHFLRKYGITIEERDQMIERQGHQCAICRTTMPGGQYGQWCVDHCHATGKVRGILCLRCNFMLGYSLDNVTTLYNAIDYLKAHNG